MPTPGFCMDVARESEDETEQYYSAVSTSPLSPSGPMGAAAAIKIEQLWYANMAAAEADASGATAAALQLAVWETVANYAEEGYTVSTTPGSSVQAAADALLAAITNNPSSPRAMLGSVDSPLYQNYVLVPVPIPGVDLFNNLVAVATDGNAAVPTGGLLAASFCSGPSPLALSDVQLVLSGSASPPAGDKLTVSLYSDNGASPPAPAGSPIATIGTLSDSQLTTFPTAVDFPLPTPIALTPETRYWICLSGTTTAQWGWSNDDFGIGVLNENAPACGVQWHYTPGSSPQPDSLGGVFQMQVTGIGDADTHCVEGDIAATPPWYFQDGGNGNDDVSPIIITFQDSYGLGTLQAKGLINCTMEGQAYDVNGNLLQDFPALSQIVATALPAGTVKVVCIAALNPGSTTGACNAQVKDMCGVFAKTADPQTTRLEIPSGGETQQLLTGILSAERLFSVLNGTPGLTNLTVIVNGQSYLRAPLTDGASKTLDVSAAMLPGDANVVLVLGQGVAGASAAIAIGDAPAGGPAFVAQPVALQIRTSAQGVQLSWLDGGAGYVLQSRSSLGPSDAWVNCPAAPQSVNGRSVVTVPASGPGQFFRLYKP